MQFKLAPIAKAQSFTLALIGAVLLAILFPELGVKGGPLKTEVTTKLAVFLTFVIQGLSLPTRQIARSAAKIKLHVFCQVAIFLAAPLAMFGLMFLSSSWIHTDLKYGFLYLAALPTTISSAIVLTSNSNGDSSAALFSTTLSNILGIFITPLWCSLFFTVGSLDSSTSLGALIAKIASMILLPLVIGQLVRPFFREWIASAKTLFKRLSNGFIVFIVFAAFCGSVSNGIWNEVGAAAILVVLALTLVFLGIFSAIVWYASRLASHSPSERIAAFFCGSQKTLAAGVPMATILFSSSGNQALGLLILPLMCYHPLQLILAGVLSPILAKKVVES